VSEFGPTLRISGVWNTKNSKLCPPQRSEAKNVLHEAGISPLVKIREQDTARIAIRVITTDSHPIRSYFMKNMTNTQPNQEQSNRYSLEQLNTWVNFR
jgi:hypothetical protein